MEARAGEGRDLLDSSSDHRFRSSSSRFFCCFRSFSSRRHRAASAASKAACCRSALSRACQFAEPGLYSSGPYENGISLLNYISAQSCREWSGAAQGKRRPPTGNQAASFSRIKLKIDSLNPSICVHLP